MLMHDKICKTPIFKFSVTTHDFVETDKICLFHFQSLPNLSDLTIRWQFVVELFFVLFSFYTEEEIRYIVDI